jgi:hypothetical protein
MLSRPATGITRISVTTGVDARPAFADAGGGCCKRPPEPSVSAFVCSHCLPLLIHNQTKW